MPRGSNLVVEVTISEHSAPGGDTHPTGLKPREGKIATLPCGCRSDDFRWLNVCDNVYAELLRLHTLALAGLIPTLSKGEFL